MPQQNKNSLEDELAQEKERILFLQAPVANTTILLVAVVVLFVFENRVDAQYLFIWVFFTILFVCLRMVIWAVHRWRPEMQSTRQWILSYTSFTGWLGLVFGMCFLFGFESQDYIVNFALSMLYFGITSAAGYVLSCHMPIYIVYTFPQALIFAGVQFAHQDFTHSLLGIAILLFLIMLTLFTRNAHRLFYKSVQLQYHNACLIDDLNEEVEQREVMVRRRTGELVQSNIELKRTEEQLRRNEQSLHHLAHHDPLTGLPNRLLLVDRLNQSIKKADRADKGLALMFIDVDNFKEVNDSLGHSLGDELLKAVASRLQNSIREEDTAARLGGDEFTIILEELEDDIYVSSVADKLMDMFKNPVSLAGNEITITLSIGISIFPQHGIDTETLLRNADTAMYRTKSEGRNGFSIYSHDLTERAVLRLAMENDLRNALPGNQFVLYFQPQVWMDSGKIEVVEALIRWMHPSEGMLFPNRFIGLAEEIGLIDDIGLWVLQSCCEKLSQWKQVGYDLRVSINVSGHQLIDDKFSSLVRDTLQQTGCDPRCIELEITERYLIRHPEKTATQCNELREMGVRMVIDDFGTGYSSLTYLKQFPISKLKIDYSFIRDILQDPNDQAIAGAILALGKSLGLTVVAEGLENEGQKDLLRAQGCELAQGDYFASPMSEENLMEYLKKSVNPRSLSG